MHEEKAHAVVVVPSLAASDVDDAALRRWLSRASVRRQASRVLDLARVLEILGRRVPDAGYAALRLWGQTGERPNVWVAAADPAFLEARLDHVHLHALSDAELTPADLQRLYDDLQQTLCGAGPTGLARIDTVGYLRGEAPLASSTLPPSLIDGCRVDDYLPGGDAANACLALSGEIEMSLHEHPVNAAREAAGLCPINALWIWGGGHVPTVNEGPLPPLFSDDPLLQGYWLCGGGDQAGWPGSVTACARQASGSFVATVPAADSGEAVSRQLTELRRLLAAGAIAKLTLVTRDGAVAELRQSDRFRFWRRNGARLLEAVNE